jgi:hypothetical protein
MIRFAGLGVTSLYLGRRQFVNTSFHSNDKSAEPAQRVVHVAHLVFDVEMLHARGQGAKDRGHLKPGHDAGRRKRGSKRIAPDGMASGMRSQTTCTTSASRRSTMPTPRPTRWALSSATRSTIISKRSSIASTTSPMSARRSQGHILRRHQTAPNDDIAAQWVRSRLRQDQRLGGRGQRKQTP